MGVYVGVKQNMGLPRVKMEEKLEIAKNQGHYGAYLGVKYNTGLFWVKMEEEY